ncbi:hypothetical protein [Paludibaculum fermentans]|uniref:Uncharacterized protein n=1 Tax=Paludibaculum fermentans TaxID=1473598 RepID=A0A7S7SHZ2_PALFE|nr:hypothetical protein [Paludibaculum fermentans]QOY85163.1 hypothetical protein IRI77_20215 [Paludibaculum fermentans]
MKGLFCLFLALAPLQAQSWSVGIPDSLITYLALTSSQAGQLAQNNNAYSELVSRKNSRIYEVQSEIATETAKDPIDPSALGVRYMEIELICRDIKKAGDDLRKNNTALLTEAQKVKLAALEEAMKLAPVYTAAQNANLLAGIRSGDFSAIIGIPSAAVFYQKWPAACNTPSAVSIYDPVAMPTPRPCRDASCVDKQK